MRWTKSSPYLQSMFLSVLILSCNKRLCLYVLGLKFCMNALPPPVLHASPIACFNIFWLLWRNLKAWNMYSFNCVFPMNWKAQETQGAYWDAFALPLFPWKSNNYIPWVCIYSLICPVCEAHVPCILICVVSGCTQFCHIVT
jgi:hypothetical protein